jgi:hypothetical protein
VTVVFPTPPLKLITAIDLGLMANFVGILLKYKLKHIVAVSRSRDRPDVSNDMKKKVRSRN